MNSLLSLGLGLLSAFFPPTHEANFDQKDSYTCTALQWTTPVAMGNDGHLKGVANVTCDFAALSGGGFPELENFLLAQLKKEANPLNSGPISGTSDALPSQTYDFQMQMSFSGSAVTAHEIGIIATDEKTQLISHMNTQSISGSSYDAYVKGFNLTLNVTPDTAPLYHGSLSVSIDMTKPWYAPESVFESTVVNAVQNAVTGYRDTLIIQLQNNI